MKELARAGGLWALGFGAWDSAVGYWLGVRGNGSWVMGCQRLSPITQDPLLTASSPQPTAESHSPPLKTQSVWSISTCPLIAFDTCDQLIPTASNTAVHSSTT